MKKLILILIALSCFAIGLIINRGIIDYNQEKAKQEFIHSFEKNLSNLTPSEIFENYWQFAAKNQLDEVKLLVTKIPSSYWLRCSNQETFENFEQEEPKNDNEFSGVIFTLRHHIQMMRANRAKLSDLKILKETIYQDEATIDFEYLRTKERAFFKKDSEGWKLFWIDSMELDFMRVDEYAHPRTVCAKAKD